MVWYGWTYCEAVCLVCLSQVVPGADEDLVRRQYRKLALMLHPDKNKTVGAEAAFKIVGEAFGVLSDKTKRTLHHLKRGYYKGDNPSTAFNSDVPAQAHTAHTTHMGYTTVVSEPMPPNSQTHPYPAYQMQYRAAAAAQATTAAPPAPPQGPHPSLTFWTSCPFCRMQYQYLRQYINFQLLCQNCKKPFPAKDINTPTINGVRVYPWTQVGAVPLAPKFRSPPSMYTIPTNNTIPNFSVLGQGFVQPPHGVSYAATANGNIPCADTAAASLSHDALQRAKERLCAERELKKKDKERERILRQQLGKAAFEAREAAKVRESIERVMSKLNQACDQNLKRKILERDIGSDEDLDDCPSGKKGKSALDDDDLEPWVNGDGDAEVSQKNWHMKEGSCMLFPKEKSLKEMHAALVDKFRREILAAKIRNPNATWTKLSTGGKVERKQEFAGVEAVLSKTRSSVTVERVDQRVGSDLLGGLNGAHLAETGAGSSPTTPAPEALVPVPDPDFHNFDAGRTEADVKRDQIWAVYDDQDGMPRFYCKIIKVCRQPFAVSGCWLEAAFPSRKPLWLSKYSLSPGNGNFRLGDDTEFDSINLFSHLMTVKKVKKVFEVYVRRDEVWAIYRDFDKEWINASPDDEKPHFRYDLLLVKSDFSEVTHGGSVISLERVKGYKTLWRPVGKEFPMSMNDLQRFSHQVPSYAITEADVPGVPPNCLELDPAATPDHEPNPTPGDEKPSTGPTVEATPGDEGTPADVVAEGTPSSEGTPVGPVSSPAEAVTLADERIPSNPVSSPAGEGTPADPVSSSAEEAIPAKVAASTAETQT